MKREYQRLLPSTVGCNGRKTQSADSGQGVSSDMCSVTPIACERCRQKKAKCNGLRPACDRCLRNGTDCEYDADEGESRSSTLKRRYSALNKEATQLRNEVHQLRMLYGHLQATSTDQAYDTFMRIRSGSYSSLVDAITSLRCDGVFETKELNDSRVFKNAPNMLSIEARNTIWINVPALPWTTIGGDEVVSELISQYFSFDRLYVYPPIHRSTFIREMQAGDPTTATCCSALLVNTICAQQCVGGYLGAVARRAMAEQFLQESKELLQKECGRMSLPTCQAACLMYAAVAAGDQLNATWI